MVRITKRHNLSETGAAIRQVSYAYGQEGETLGVSGSVEPVTYTYDGQYRLATLTDGNGVTTTYTHSADPESLLTKIAYSDGRTPDVTFTYDGYGRRYNMFDGTGRTAYYYDDNDAVTSSKELWTPIGSIAPKALFYAYYLNGSRKSMSVLGGMTFSYVYDNDGRMTQETNPNGEVSSWAYKENSWLASQTLGNGAKTSYTYNKRGQVIDQKTTNSDGITLINEFNSPSTGAFDGAGDRTQVVVSGLPSGYGGTTSYAYDQRGQLTNESSTRPNFGAARTYQYDGVMGGTSTGPGNTTLFNGASRTYNADNQTTSNTYDGNGNPTTYQGTALTFDAESRMLTSGTAQTNGYTGDGLRAWKQQGSSRTSRTYFLRDGLNPVFEYNSSGALTATNTWGANGLLSRRVGITSTFYRRGPHISVRWRDGWHEHGAGQHNGAVYQQRPHQLPGWGQPVRVHGE